MGRTLFSVGVPSSEEPGNTPVLPWMIATRKDWLAFPPTKRSGSRLRATMLPLRSAMPAIHPEGSWSAAMIRLKYCTVSIARNASVACPPWMMGTVTATTLMGLTGELNAPDTLGVCVRSASWISSGACACSGGPPSGAEVRKRMRPSPSTNVMARMSRLRSTMRRAWA